jgi:hypothetical protein
MTLAMTSVTWNGTFTEQLELIAAIERNCECIFDAAGLRVQPCAAHAMLAGDQRALNGLLWTRRLAKLRLAEEGISAS